MANTPDTKTSWNLTPLFNSDDDPRIEKSRQELIDASYSFIKKWKDSTEYLTNPEILKEALDEYEMLSAKYAGSGDEGYYFWLRTQQDQNDTELKAKYNKIKDLSIKIGNDIQFFPYRIAKIPPKDQEKFLNHPGLSTYKHYLKNLFDESKYLLSEDEEKILNLVSSTSIDNWVHMTASFLSKEERKVLNAEGKKVTKNFSELTDLMNNKNKQIRDSAAAAFNDVLEKHADTAEHEMNSVLEFKKVNDDLRKVERPDLLTHVGDDMETGVVDAMLDSVEKRFDISKRFYKLKAKLLGVEKLSYHERNVEYGNIDRDFPWPETVEIVNKTFEKLDKEFSGIFQDFVKNGQIDVFPKKGKTDGGFCVSFTKNQPIYILLNHTSTLRDVTTVAHEMGHAINDVLTNRAQNALNGGTSTATTEVASTFMEDFVLREIVKESDDELKLTLLMSRLNDAVSSIQRQVAAYRFEQQLHSEFKSKGYLSKERIGEIFQKNMKAYMGDSVIATPGSANWWVYWSHLRRFFYVYTYASGLLISKSLQNSVKHNPEFILKFKEFLAAGTSESPKNIFAQMGVDISDKSFWDRGLEEIAKELTEAEVLAKKLGKI